MALVLFVCSTGLASAPSNTRGPFDNALEGDFSVGSDPEDKTHNTHFDIHLTGDAAKALYEHMKIAPERDGCLGDGTLMKNIKGTACTVSRDGSEYECYFGIDIKHQKITWAVPIC